MLLQNYDGSLVCTCGNDIFVTHGDDFGFTIIECIKCDKKTSIMESSLFAEKLLSPRGEDYCKVFGRVIEEETLGGIVMVDYLLFTEFDTAVMISVEDRMKKIRLAKNNAVKNEWYEMAARLRQEEKVAECILQQLNKYLML